MKARSFSVPFLYLWLGLFAFFPLLLTVLTSLLSRDSVHLVTLPFTLSNYTALFSSIFMKVFFRSLCIAVIATFLCLLIAYPFSFLIVKSKHQSLFILLIIIPFWTSSLVRTYSLIAILKYKGVLNAILMKLHLIDAPLNLLYTNFSVLTGLVYNLFPFMVLPILTNMERFDFRLIEAAKDLGAGRLAIFWRVFLPNTAPGIVSGSLLVLLPAMTLFYIPDVLGGARSVLLGNLIQTQFLVLEDWPQGSATSLILTIMLLIAVAIYRRKNREVIV